MLRCIQVGEPDIQAAESRHLRYQAVTIDNAYDTSGKSCTRKPPTSATAISNVALSDEASNRALASSGMMSTTAAFSRGPAEQSDGQPNPDDP